MTQPEDHFTAAYYEMSELGGLGQVTDSEEEYNRAVYRNCLRAIEEAVTAGIVEKGRAVPDERTDRIELLLSLYDCTAIPESLPDDIDATPFHEPMGPIDDPLRRWAEFDPSEHESLDIEDILEDIEVIIGGVKFLVGTHRVYHKS